MFTANLRCSKFLLTMCTAVTLLACGAQEPPSGMDAGETDSGVPGIDAGLADGGLSDGGQPDAGEQPAPTPALRATDPLEPATALAGTGGLQLTVHGTGFIAASLVRWAGADRPTTFVDATTLRAMLGAADLETPSEVNVTVFNPAALGGGTSGPATFTVAAPLPSLSSSGALSPASVLAASGGFTLTVRGVGFLPTTVVRWNGVDQSTTHVSATELHAAIAAADVATAATISVTVATPAPGGGVSAAATFLVENPVPVLATAAALSPSSIEEDSGAFTLTVWGTNFVPTSVGRWNANARPTRFKSVTELEVSISAQDIEEGGMAEVTVFNVAPGGGETVIPALFRIREGRGAFMRASLSNAGAQGDDASIVPAISETGRYVAFASDATNLVTGDLWGTTDVFVRDTCIGASTCAPSTVRVSVSPTGADGLGSSGSPSLSPNGRFVAFASLAANLVVGDTNSQVDVFLRDTCIGAQAGCTPQTQRVSVDANGLEGNDTSELPAVSANGRFVAFRSTASNLVAGDTNGSRDVFVRDTCFGATGCTPSTILVSQSTAGVAGNTDSGNERPAISADGRYVAFSSSAWTLLATPDGNARSDVFLHDTCFTAGSTCTRSTIRVSVGDQGQEGNNAATAPGLSFDARFVVFESRSDNLLSGDTNAASDIFIRDTCLGVASGCTPGIERVSLTATGVEANGSSVDPVMSGDGRFVAWTTYAPNLMPTAQGGVVRDTCRGATGCMPSTIHVTLAAPGGVNPSTYWGTLALSHDGRFAAWTADQAGIVPNDTNGRRDIFVSHTGF